MITFSSLYLLQSSCRLKIFSHYPFQRQCFRIQHWSCKSSCSTERSRTFKEKVFLKLNSKWYAELNTLKDHNLWARITYLALVSGPLASSIWYGIELFPINFWTIVYGCFVCFDKVYSHPYSTPFIKSEFPIEYLSNFQYLLHFIIVQ